MMVTAQAPVGVVLSIMYLQSTPSWKPSTVHETCAARYVLTVQWSNSLGFDRNLLCEHCTWGTGMTRMTTMTKTARNTTLFQFEAEAGPSSHIIPKSQQTPGPHAVLLAGIGELLAKLIIANAAHVGRLAWLLQLALASPILHEMPTGKSSKSRSFGV